MKILIKQPSGQVLIFIKMIYRPILLLGFGVIFIYYFMHHTEDFKNLRNVSLINLFLIFLLQGLIIVINSWFLTRLIRLYNIKLKASISFMVTLKASIINFFGFLQGGVGYRAVYLKKKFNLPYKDFAYIFAANYIVVFVVSTLMGLLALFLRKIDGLYIDPIVFWIFTLITVSLTFLILFGPQINVNHRNIFLKKIDGVFVGWRKITQDKNLMFSLFLLSFFQYSVMVLLFYIELASLGYTPSLSGIMVFASVANFSLLLALTPAAIGFREGLLIFSQNSLGVDTSAIILSSTIDRSIYFLGLVIFAVAIQKPFVNISRKIHRLIALRKRP